MDADTAKAISRSRHLCEQSKHKRASAERVIETSLHTIRYSERLIERTRQAGQATISRSAGSSNPNLSTEREQMGPER